MRKLLLSTVICSLLLWSCEKHPGKASDGYSPIARDIAKSMIRHYLDSNVVRNDTTIIRNTGIPREYLLWMLKDKKTIRARLMLAAYLDSEPVEYRNTITMVLQLMNVNKKDTTYTYFDMRRPIKSMRPGQPDPSLCPPPNNCDIEGEVSDL